MKWLFHSCLTLSRSSCRKSENTNQTHSMSKWFPKASFNEFLKKSITHAVKCLLLCDHQPCMCWLACANEQLCATVSPDKKHCKAASIPLSVPQSVCTNIGRSPFSSTALGENWLESRDHWYFYMLWATIFSWKIHPRSHVLVSR